jgi:predicted transcriptional regulator
MNIVERLRSDVERGLLEHQAKVLLQALRQRLGELTLGDLRDILASKLGRGLESLRVIELTGETGEAAAPAGTSQAGKRATGKAKGKGKGKATAGKPAKGAARAGTFGAALLDLVLEKLRVGAALTSGELRAALGGSKATMYRAVRELVRAGKVQTAGKPARYSLKAEGEAARPEAAAEAPAEQPAKQEGVKKAAKKGGAKKAAKVKAKKKGGAKKAAKSGGAKKAAKTGGAKKAKAGDVSARSVEGRAQYDARVIAALREAGDWIGATQLREKIGGSDNQVRIALHRLITGGQVTRRGARNSTEYRVGG